VAAPAQIRTLGRGGPTVSAIGIGCWAIGGLTNEDGRIRGWGGTDDRESIRAIRLALDLGVTLVDTADAYGAGHSERLVGEALKGRRDGVVFATKFAKTFDEATRSRFAATDVRPDAIRRACEASLRRLQTDVIDLYQLHDGSLPPQEAEGVLEVLESLVAAGKIRSYGWSTDDPARAAAFARGEHCAAIQHRMNLFEGNAALVRLCEDHGLASINRSPLAQGLLTGKFDAATTFESYDVRAGWRLAEGPKSEQLKTLAAVRDLLTAGGRTLAQGALGWLLALSPACIPIPGFKTAEQVRDNAGALEAGPLPPDVMAALAEVLAQPTARPA
jgi:aryl-alcohol dehydrogenase-like predicted oxidoreductase